MAVASVFSGPDCTFCYRCRWANAYILRTMADLQSSMCNSMIKDAQLCLTGKFPDGCLANLETGVWGPWVPEPKQLDFCWMFLLICNCTAHTLMHIHVRSLSLSLSLSQSLSDCIYNAQQLQRWEYALRVSCHSLTRCQYQKTATERQTQGDRRREGHREDSTSDPC